MSLNETNCPSKVALSFSQMVKIASRYSFVRTPRFPDTPTASYSRAALSRCRPNLVVS